MQTLMSSRSQFPASLISLLSELISVNYLATLAFITFASALIRSDLWFLCHSQCMGNFYLHENEYDGNINCRGDCQPSSIPILIFSWCHTNPWSDCTGEPTTGYSSRHYSGDIYHTTSWQHRTSSFILTAQTRDTIFNTDCQ